MTYRDSSWEEEKRTLLAEMQSLKDQLKLIETRHGNGLPKFEYATINVPYGSLSNADLNKLSNGGWKFIAFAPNGAAALFERPVAKPIDFSNE